MPTEELTGWLDWLDAHPYLQTLLASAALVLAAWVSNWIVKRILVRGLYKLLRHARTSDIEDFGVIKRLSNIVPALVLSTGVHAVPGLPEAAVTVVRNVCGGFIVLTVALALGGVLDIVNMLYQRRSDARIHPIKGYLQVVKIGLYAIATILIIATLIDRSPLILLSGLGAMAAVLMLIFQDTLLSLVASVQITSNDLIRVGDWVEMPQLNADGDVIDIALHTVKVQNWDKTITSIPTKRFISDSFKNWRGMQESGGRRIKRSLYLDQQSVHFLDAEERKRLYRFNLLEEYLVNKRKEIDEWNAKLAERGQEPVNTRRVTNIGTFRAYVERYLRSHPGVHQRMTLLVRQLSPTADGLPLEIYCFTNTVAWAEYEAIQSDIFDHLLAILPEFGLRVFQHPSGGDMRDWCDAVNRPQPRMQEVAPDRSQAQGS
ncbi:MAG TPA: mechanosensitive ion channel family protein [Pseudomonas sp.]|jgi:miniconductance mechanosensitive channel|uniref:mechanosensitive ion channel family protein n=1 Tax=Stutzerimonas balearica TaxID=74829 RepID=UPI000596ED2A|nr:mechanosensitive ion channel family protein [Stutzerimonas balearica]KIL04575.1 mechanosensitive ion channel protein MscS [Stutzerimonas stutzeri]MBB61344.1 mechanosensitive ion channel family protein [Pseudomonas sp.]MBD3737438.1 mechanosensitive ion channel family protein [Stutzerimonas balearica]HAF92034.1 mechanosensitive ion channel family protein [Pseudomonas sp.]|tara:strand:+ start:384 stop:1676 length:1293 start_codon:yes stop_codon:yes gene_type:complete